MHGLISGTSIHVRQNQPDAHITHQTKTQPHTTHTNDAMHPQYYRWARTLSYRSTVTLAQKHHVQKYPSPHSSLNTLSTPLSLIGVNTQYRTYTTVYACMSVRVTTQPKSKIPRSLTPHHTMSVHYIPTYNRIQQCRY